MRYSKIQYVCWLFSGAEISLLRECPTDFNRQASIGFTIFMTCLLAGLSGGFAAWRFTINPITQEGNWVASIIFGLVWGMLVFSIDRSMVVTLKKNPTLNKQPFFIPLVTRMILAGLLAFMISIPLETKIFEPEIEKQALEDVQNAKLNFGRSVASTSGISDVEARRKEAAEQAIIANQQISLADSKVPGVAGLLADAASQDAIQRSKNIEAQHQVALANKARAQSYVPPHTDPTTGQQNEGYFSSNSPAGKRYREAKTEQKNLEYAANVARNKAAQFRIDARKKADLFRTSADNIRNQAIAASGLAEAERAKLKAKNDTANATYEKQVQKRGFVSQFVSMENAAKQKQNGSMLFFLWFIRILFFVIEILPTIVKLATPVGEYDHQLYAHEQMFALALRTNYKILEDREMVRQQTELNISTQLEQIRQDKEIELGQRMLEQTANIQNSLAKQMLSDWHRVERERIKVASTPPQPSVTALTAVPVLSKDSAEINVYGIRPNKGEITNAAPATNSHPLLTSILQSTNSIESPSLDNSTHAASTVSSHTNLLQSSVSPISVLQAAGSEKTQFSGKKWYLQSDGASQMYYFQDSGSSLNTLIHQPQNGKQNVGKWEHPQGNYNILRIVIEDKEKEYKITHITDTDLHLLSDNGEQLNFKTHKT